MKYNKGDKFTFNTHRPYTPHGQIINITVLKVEHDEQWDMTFYTVSFIDESRNIEGVLTDLWDCDEDTIMRAYDRGGYVSHLKWEG
jgi:hypothetical protein